MSLSLRHDFLASDESFSSASYLSTFVAGDCRPCRIHGQGTLIRLVDSSRYNPFAPSPGDYWTEAAVFQRFMLDAAADLAAQNRAPNAALTGLYARFQLRDGLAVSRDWSNLDAYIVLELSPGQSVVALVGPARGQGYYSVKQPVERGKAEAAGITLPGLTDQIVINFEFEENRKVLSHVRGPFVF
jgi:hypothetical protein